MKTVYYFLGHDLKKIVNAIDPMTNIICQTYYHLKGNLPEIINDNEEIIYWIENHEAKQSFRFKTNISDYKYKKLELIDIFTKIKIKFNENRLQEQETHVVRGDDREGSGIQGRRGQTSITVGHLSYKTIKG